MLTRTKQDKKKRGKTFNSASAKVAAGFVTAAAVGKKKPNIRCV